MNNHLIEQQSTFQQYVSKEATPDRLKNFIPYNFAQS